MGPTLPPTSSTYRLVADGHSASPIILKAILESWCYLNCSGLWEANIFPHPSRDDAPEKVLLDLHEDGDAMLFMMSPEYGYMGKPPVKPLTI